MEIADFRRLALSLEGAEEGSHMGAADFRVGARIFATLAAQSQGFGNLMITPEMQAEFVEAEPEVFVPIPGGWGRNGRRMLCLRRLTRTCLRGRFARRGSCGKKRMRRRGRSVVRRLG